MCKMLLASFSTYDVYSIIAVKFLTLKRYLLDADEVITELA